jgi:hypothetical protein
MSDACGAPGSCGSNVEVSCEGKADCPPGMVCCGIGNMIDWQKVSCVVKCDGSEFCGKGGVCSEADQVCVPSMKLGKGYAFCVDTTL